MTICKKCKWFRNSPSDPTSMRMESCKMPKVIERCHITGAIDYPDCGEINNNGQCQYYEEKQLWYKRLLRFFTDSGLSEMSGDI